MLSTDKLPRIIFFVGVDGAGKSYFTQKLLYELKNQGASASHLWLRFSNITSKPLLALCRILKLNYYENHHDVRVGYHDFEKSKTVSALFIFLQLIDVWIVTLIKLWPRLLLYRVIVCDRGVFDTLVDVMVDTKKNKLYSQLIGKLYTALLPKSYVVIYLSRDPDKIFEMRPDVFFDRNFNIRVSLYNTCAEFFDWKIVDNNHTETETFKSILSELQN